MEEIKTARGGKRAGAGRKSAFGADVDTAQYLLPKSCAEACQAYARVMLANSSNAPMRCVSEWAEMQMELKKGDLRVLKSIIDRWHACGIETVMMELRRADPDHDYVTLSYKDVVDLAEVVREFGEKTGYAKGFKDADPRI